MRGGSCGAPRGPGEKGWRWCPGGVWPACRRAGHLRRHPPSSKPEPVAAAVQRPAAHLSRLPLCSAASEPGSRRWELDLHGDIYSQLGRRPSPGIQWTVRRRRTTAGLLGGHRGGAQHSATCLPAVQGAVPLEGRIDLRGLALRPGQGSR